MSDMIKEMMKKKADAKRDPAFYEAQTELTHKLGWAEIMQAQGRLSKSDLDEFRAHLIGDYLAAMPTEMFVEMTRDGSYGDLEKLASHDGKRDGRSVIEDRKKLSARITSDALDTALAENKISAKRYNEERKSLGSFDDARTQLVNDAESEAEHDEVALDYLIETTMPEGDRVQFELPAADDGAPKDASED